MAQHLRRRKRPRGATKRVQKAQGRKPKLSKPVRRIAKPRIKRPKFLPKPKLSKPVRRIAKPRIKRPKVLPKPRKKRASPKKTAPRKKRSAPPRKRSRRAAPSPPKKRGTLKPRKSRKAAPKLPKASKKPVIRLGKALRTRLTIENARTLREVLPKKGLTRIYASPEGVAVANLRFKVPRRADLAHLIRKEVSEILRALPKKAFTEGNFLFPPPEHREGYSRWKGQDRLQTYPHRKANLVLTMTRIASRLHARPQEIMIRVGIRAEGGKPFDRKKPKKRGQ